MASAALARPCFDRQPHLLLGNANGSSCPWVPAVQRIEHRDPVLAGDHRLAVDRERLHA
jgi:hypothetical protein